MNCHICIDHLGSLLVRLCCVLWLNVTVCLYLLLFFLVLSKVATEDVMLSLGGCVLIMSVFYFVFVIFGVICRFTSWVGCKSEVLSWGVDGVFTCVSITWV